MTESYDLTKLDPNTFEHLINLLALRVLGAGHTGFGPGSDGGRDGYFEGEAPYPSETDRWSGKWYIQSKFHKPHLSKDPQKWLIERIKEEIKEFTKSDSKRTWPDNWIVATNIDPSGEPMTGAFDQAKKLVSAARPELKERFHIWGGSKVIHLLTLNPEVYKYYSHFLTPGHILTAIYDQIKDAQAEIDTILRFLIVRQFSEQQYTKLEQAGSDADNRPGIHRLFIDLPFHAKEYNLSGMTTEFLVRASAKNHRIDPQQPDTDDWRLWRRHPSRARVWVVKGGPGQGKSTVSQYFCQIQRAALILQDDGPTVLPNVKTLANEFRIAAETAGFWPIVPRIPISIELRDYAQWYGRKNSREARGILTYLAEVISSNVEQKVLVGTLRRALQNRGWLIVFDGLDEVPHDVKDSVSSEVRNFVDNIVVENNSDAMTFCTSRPQGYSGQFADMDGPTIDLINLSPEAALKCAAPVLALGRSESEANRSLEVLKAAIGSSSVRELMTTPLQSHIMAVVVRDGGRPPERRWQLFTNFYQVIRKREANRNLPDEKLAKLLREDEQLLKTVHNRLGFLLHSRAETSEGAQTSLDRAEFTNLVKDAVELMKETDVEVTVNVLMEATTDRLVLVSTPDDGDHLRFDIRPLQEFFAAEFIYESVDAEELRRRLDLITGDSHWREVVHFMMSALIENNRKTELAVATAVLENLDEGNDTLSHRLLNRRLGLGAILAARLLQEGVLEQDKRIRQQFRKCLQPLAGFTDLEALQYLSQVNQQDSKSWLINFLVDALHEFDKTENIGAVLALAQILKDEDHRTEIVKQIVLSSPPPYICAFLNLLTEAEIFYPSRTFEKWVLDVVLKLILDTDWTFLGKEGLEAVINLIRGGKDFLNEVASENGLSTLQVEWLRELIKPLVPNHNKTPDIDLGVVNGSYFSHDWTTGTSIISSVPNELIEGQPKSTGLLELIYKIFNFGKVRSLSALMSVFDSIGENTESLGGLPPNILAYLPINTDYNLNNQIKELKSLSEAEFNNLLENHRVGSRKIYRAVRWHALGPTSTPEQWSTLLDMAPQMAVYIWSDMLWERPGKTDRPSFLNNPETVDALINKFLKTPELMLSIPNIWGKFMAEAPRRESEFRQTILLLAPSYTSVTRDKGIVREFHPIRLNLPVEAPFLPFIIKALSNAVDITSKYSFYGISYGQLEPKDVPEIITTMFGSQLNVLIEIAQDVSIEPKSRASAVLLNLLSMEGGNDLEAKHQILLNLYTPELEEWFWKCVSIYLVLIAKKTESLAKSLCNNILDLTRADYYARHQLDPILDIWRESSRAPVQSVGAQEKWLSEP